MKKIIEILSFFAVIVFMAFCFISLFSHNGILFWSGASGLVLLALCMYADDRRQMKRRKAYWESTGL